VVVLVREQVQVERAQVAAAALIRPLIPLMAQVAAVVVLALLPLVIPAMRATVVFMAVAAAEQDLLPLAL
jgi:hypothetical protein